LATIGMKCNIWRRNSSRIKVTCNLLDHYVQRDGLGLDFGGAGCGRSGYLEGVACWTRSEVGAVAASGDLRGSGNDDRRDQRAQPAAFAGNEHHGEAGQ